MTDYYGLATRLTESYTKLDLQNLRKDLNNVQKELPKLTQIPLIKTVLSLSQITSKYSNGSYKEKALECIDFERIYSGVDKRESLQAEQAASGKLSPSQTYGYQDFIVLELLDWFKSTFFKWVNQPDCPTCQTNTNVIGIGADRPRSAEEIAGEAGVVELYRCSQCETQIRFPRLNNPAELLKSRRGRCGEWCNCFMLILTSMEIPCRYIWNFEDHVWCEIYSSTQKRWIHIDCCENSFDEPSLYGKGWGKKMSYVFAVDDNGFTDVSARYVDDGNRLPRDKVDEASLKRVIRYLNCVKLLNYFTKSNGDIDALYKRLVQNKLDCKDLKETTNEPPTKTDNPKPRQSGKGEWTEQRGENGGR